ncbi:unnamed protein product [Amoebophrya sp. A120]|nr:unnamed protein product [Amoebophrya sp. A120]|eukprot:GSA120T00000105001.1
MLFCEAEAVVDAAGAIFPTTIEEKCSHLECRPVAVFSQEAFDALTTPASSSASEMLVDHTVVGRRLSASSTAVQGAALDATAQVIVRYSVIKNVCFIVAYFRQTGCTTAGENYNRDVVATGVEQAADKLHCVMEQSTTDRDQNKTTKGHDVVHLPPQEELLLQFAACTCNVLVYSGEGGKSDIIDPIFQAPSTQLVLRRLRRLRGKPIVVDTSSGTAGRSTTPASAFVHEKLEDANPNPAPEGNGNDNEHQAVVVSLAKHVFNCEFISDTSDPGLEWRSNADRLRLFFLKSRSTSQLNDHDLFHPGGHQNPLYPLSGSGSNRQSGCSSSLTVRQWFGLLRTYGGFLLGGGRPNDQTALLQMLNNGFEAHWIRSFVEPEISEASTIAAFHWNRYEPFLFSISRQRLTNNRRLQLQRQQFANLSQNYGPYNGQHGYLLSNQMIPAPQLLPTVYSEISMISGHAASVSSPSEGATTEFGMSSASFRFDLEHGLPMSTTQLSRVLLQKSRSGSPSAGVGGGGSSFGQAGLNMLGSLSGTASKQVPPSLMLGSSAAKQRATGGLSGFASSSQGDQMINNSSALTPTEGRSSAEQVAPQVMEDEQEERVTVVVQHQGSFGQDSTSDQEQNNYPETALLASGYHSGSSPASRFFSDAESGSGVGGTKHDKVEQVEFKNGEAIHYISQNKKIEQEEGEQSDLLEEDEADRISLPTTSSSSDGEEEDALFEEYQLHDEVDKVVKKVEPGPALATGDVDHANANPRIVENQNQEMTLNPLQHSLPAVQETSQSRHHAAPTTVPSQLPSRDSSKVASQGGSKSTRDQRKNKSSSTPTHLVHGASQPQVNPRQKRTLYYIVLRRLKNITKQEFRNQIRDVMRTTTRTTLQLRMLGNHDLHHAGIGAAGVDNEAAAAVIFNQRGSTTSQELSTGEIISSTTAKPSTPNSAPFSRHLVYRKFQEEIIDVREQLIKQKYLQWIEDIAREECKLFAATLQQAMKRYERQRTFDEAALAGVVATTGGGSGTKSGTIATVAGGRATRNGTSSTSGATTTASSSKTPVLIEQGATALSGLLSMRRPSNVSPMTTIERIRQQNMGNKTAKNGINGASTASSKNGGKLKNGSGSSAAAPTAAEIKQEMREKERLHKRHMTTLLLDSWWSLLELFSVLINPVVDADNAISFNFFSAPMAAANNPSTGAGGGGVLSNKNGSGGGTGSSNSTTSTVAANGASSTIAAATEREEKSSFYLHYLRQNEMLYGRLHVFYGDLFLDEQKMKSSSAATSTPKKGGKSPPSKKSNKNGTTGEVELQQHYMTIPKNKFRNTDGARSPQSNASGFSSQSGKSASSSASTTRKFGFSRAESSSLLFPTELRVGVKASMSSTSENNNKSQSGRTDDGQHLAGPSSCEMIDSKNTGAAGGSGVATGFFSSLVEEEKVLERVWAEVVSPVLQVDEMRSDNTPADICASIRSAGLLILKAEDFEKVGTFQKCNKCRCWRG